MKTQHRCVSSGETVELQARYLKDARQYITIHESCDSIPCSNYHEPSEIEQ